MIPTPILPLSSAEYKNVYEPAEDSFLLMDTLHSELPFNFAYPLVVEIGSGSGILSAFFSKLIPCFSICSDINIEACRATIKTSKYNNINLDVLNDDFISFRDGLIDILIFNPPYVVTDEEELRNAKGIEFSWAGGIDGRQVIDKFLSVAGKLLSKDGVVYMVVINKNKPNEILESVGKYGLSGSIVNERKTPLEHLYVLKFRKIDFF